ncbi:hypothetical protein AB0C12_21515 [Actinoplanes sp. NPDC048967]|uniref:hypothetical protein n=1 Tax=Actinoplanes sp. NPDC048967 TaxID=3155269 RepID=UPI0033EFA6C5
MSDFDEVLERLLTDPSFQAQLAADPAGALVGYVLDAEEADLLRQQVSTDAGAHTAVVEDRVTKSSTFGLFSSFGLGDVAGSVGHGLVDQGTAAPGTVSQGLGAAATDSSAGLGEWSEFGSATGTATEGFGSAPEAWGTGGMSAQSGLGTAPEFPARAGFGSAPGPDLDGLPAVSALGDAPRSGLGESGSAHSGLGEPEQLAPPKGYHNRVDADGDGHLDKATYRGREDGGAEIRVDLDRDGQADFVGVDKDLDNRVDFADYDKDHDGVFEKRMFDDDGDGFLDRTVLH